MLRNFFVLAFVVFAFVAISSCEKNEVFLVPETTNVVDKTFIDTIAYKIQALAFKVPTRSEILTARLGLKSGALEDKSLSVRIISADTSSCFVYTNNLNERIFVRPVVYYELLNGARKEYLTADQKYPIVDGKINPDVYSIEIEFACPYARYFSFRNSNYIINVNYLFMFDDKTISPISYLGNGFNGIVKLAPLSGGHWELLVTQDDGADFRKEYTTGPIDFFGSTVLYLKYEIKPENTVAKVKIPTILLQGAQTVNLVGIDPETGLELCISYRVSMNNTSSEVNYDAPFDIAYVVICGDDGCKWYESEIYGIEGDISLFRIKK